jgi:hypothetical protein
MLIKFGSKYVTQCLCQRQSRCGQQPLHDARFGIFCTVSLPLHAARSHRGNDHVYTRPVTCFGRPFHLCSNINTMQHPCWQQMRPTRLLLRQQLLQHLPLHGAQSSCKIIAQQAVLCAAPQADAPAQPACHAQSMHALLQLWTSDADKS